MKKTKVLKFKGVFCIIAGIALFFSSVCQASSLWHFQNELSVGTLSTINKSETTRLSGIYNYSIAVSHKKSHWSLGAQFGRFQQYSYEMEDGHDGDWKNPGFTLNHSFRNLLDLDKVNLSFLSQLPMSRDSLRRDFQGSLGGRVSLSERYLKRLTLSQGVGYSYSFYKFDIADDGQVLSPHIFTSETLFHLEITNNIFSILGFELEHSVSFQNVGKSGTMTTLAAGYTQQTWDVLLGISTKAGTLSPEGTSNRITFHDPRYTQVFLNLSYRI